MFLTKQEALLEVLQGRKILQTNGLAALFCPKSTENVTFFLNIHYDNGSVAANQTLSLANFDNAFSYSKWIRESDLQLFMNKQSEIKVHVREYHKFMQDSIKIMKNELASASSLHEKAVKMLSDSLSVEYYHLLQEALDYGLQFKDIFYNDSQHLQNT